MNNKLICFLFVSLFFMAVKPYAFAENEPDTYHLNNPYQAIKHHLEYLQDNNYRPDIAAKSLNAVDFTEEEATVLAEKLYQVFTGRGYYIDLEEIPQSAQYFDSVRNEAKFYPFPDDEEIFLRKSDGQWLYSRKTVALIEKKHKEVFPFGTDVLVNLLQKHGDKKLLGLYYWQYVGIFILVIFSFIAHRLFTFLIGEIVFRIINRTSRGIISLKLLKPAVKPASLFLITLVIAMFVPVLQLPIIAAKYTVLVLKGAIPLFAMLIAYRLVDLLGGYFELVAARTKSTLDDQLVPLLRKSLKVFVVAIGVIFILQNLDFNVTALLAGISIGGLAFALAAQDTIKNLFGSLMIFLDKPFQVGDWVTSGDIDGTVEEVGFRSTRVRTFRNSLVYVPNAKLADATIDNHGLRQFRRFYTRLGITYDTPPDLIVSFVEGLRKIVEIHPHTRKDVYHIYLNEFGASSLEIMFYVFFKAPDWGKELTYRHELMLEIIHLANHLGVRFAFPTQTLHVETFPDKPSLTPVYSMTADELKKQIQGFYRQRGYSAETKEG